MSDKKPSKKFHDPVRDEKVPETRVVKKKSAPFSKSAPFKKNEGWKKDKRSDDRSEKSPGKSSFRQREGEGKFKKDFGKKRSDSGEGKSREFFKDSLRKDKRSDERTEKPFGRSSFTRKDEEGKFKKGSGDRKKEFGQSKPRGFSKEGPRKSKPFGTKDRERKFSKEFENRESEPAGIKTRDFFKEALRRDLRMKPDSEDIKTAEKIDPEIETKADKKTAAPEERFSKSKGKSSEEKPFKGKPMSKSPEREKGFKGKNDKKGFSKRSEKSGDRVKALSDAVRLNRFIANSGVCSRRDADELISLGKIEVNGTVVTEMGYKVGEKDIVKYAGKRLYNIKPVYIIMNKPKDCICTAEDPEGRRTVLDILAEDVDERVFPVGRLDRNTTGVLLITNDGELTQKLTHPSSNMSKVYSATLDKPLENEHLEQLLIGVELEDGEMKADDIAYSDAGDKRKIGIEIHSGRNRIIHRMFEHLGYRVERLDRVLFAGMDKRGLKRGEWRYMNEKEITSLKRLK